MSTSVHVCGDTCACPVHGTPLLYWPAGDDHACRDVSCRYGHGMKDRWPPRGARILIALAADGAGEGLTSRQLATAIGERYLGKPHETIPVSQAAWRLHGRGLVEVAGHAPGPGSPYIWRITGSGREYLAAWRASGNRWAPHVSFP